MPKRYNSWEDKSFIVRALTNFCIKFRLWNFYCLLTDFSHFDFSTRILYNFTFTNSVLWEVGVIFGADSLQIQSSNIPWRLFILYIIFFFGGGVYYPGLYRYSVKPMKRVQTADWMKKTLGEKKKLPLFRFLSEDIRILNFFYL